MSTLANEHCPDEYSANTSISSSNGLLNLSDHPALRHSLMFIPSSKRVIWNIDVPTGSRSRTGLKSRSEDLADAVPNRYSQDDAANASAEAGGLKVTVPKSRRRRQ